MRKLVAEVVDQLSELFRYAPTCERPVPVTHCSGVVWRALASHRRDHGVVAHLPPFDITDKSQAKPSCTHCLQANGMVKRSLLSDSCLTGLLV